MNASTKKKSEQLGMPFGTAQNRLRKLIIFDLLQRFGLNICCRCQQPIESPNILTIDHLEPWQDIDVNRFWDLKNIGFAHTKCNLKHRTGKIESPPGQSWCSTCKTHKPIEDFFKVNQRWNGYSWRCKVCYNGTRSKKKTKITLAQVAQ